jgi:hypothetical protein
MHFLAATSAVSGLVLLFLSWKPGGFRLVGGISSLLSAAYIYGMAESLQFVESLGMPGFSLWLGLLVLLAVSLVGELSIKGRRMKGLAIV